MKKKMLLFIVLIFLVVFSISAFPGNKKGCGVILMGEVQEVSKDTGDGSLRVLVKGYLKGCEVYKEEVLVLVNKETMIIPNNCNEANKKEKLVKYNPEEVKVEKGDIIFVKLSEAMTKSIPPQSVAKKIQISKVNNR